MNTALQIMTPFDTAKMNTTRTSTTTINQTTVRAIKLQRHSTLPMNKVLEEIKKQKPSPGQRIKDRIAYLLAKYESPHQMFIDDFLDQLPTTHLYT